MLSLNVPLGHSPFLFFKQAFKSIIHAFNDGLARRGMGNTKLLGICPSRPQAPAPCPHGQGTWAGSLRTVLGRIVPAGGLLPAVGLPKGLVEMRLPAPLCLFLQAPVVAALLPEEQWVALPVSSLRSAGLGTLWGAPPSEMLNLSSILVLGAHPSISLLGLCHPQCLNPVGMWALLAPTKWDMGVSGTTVGVLEWGDQAGLEKGASMNLIRSNKCRLWPLGMNKPRPQHRRGPPCWKAAWQRRSCRAPQ